MSDLAVGVPGRSSNAPHIVSQASDVVEEIPDAFLHYCAERTAMVCQW